MTNLTDDEIVAMIEPSHFDLRKNLPSEDEIKKLFNQHVPDFELDYTCKQQRRIVATFRTGWTCACMHICDTDWSKCFEDSLTNERKF